MPGAVEAVQRLTARGTPYRFVTNTTSKPRSALVARLRGYGFEARPEQIFTALRAGAELAKSLGFRSIAPFVAPAALEDLSEFELAGGTAGPPDRRTADAVLIGDLGDLWSFALLQEAFEYVQSGATLIALSRDRYWLSGGRLTLDAGPFVAGLEYATQTQSRVAGKPNPDFFHGAVRSLGLEPGTTDVVMIGDDIWGDIQGAQQAGYRGWLVKTGKFREEVLVRSGVVPDRVLESVADL